MSNRNVRLCTLLALLCAFATACIHKTGGAVTPWERVTTYNAAIAEANNAIERGGEAAVLANALTVPQAAPLLNWTGEVALLHQQITSILAQGSVTSANLASVSALSGVIKSSILTLPPEALGIKNPKTQQTFQADVMSISTLVDSLLAALEQIVGTPGLQPSAVQPSGVQPIAYTGGA